MNTKKSLITLSILTSILFSANNTFTRGGSGWNVAGPILAVGAVSSIAAASSANARDRDYARYQAERARERAMIAERKERRREKIEEMRHRERMAAINARNQGNVQPPMNMDAYYDYNE